MSRVTLARIPALTFYKDSLTLSRRTTPIPQLACVGKPCNLYTPDVVRCENIGGTGTEVDWKCEADLPAALRFGRVEVSCEGWSGPGDAHVLKGSCALEYRLVRIPDSLHAADDHSSLSRSFDIPHILFLALWGAFLLFIVYSFFKSCLRSNPPLGPAPRPRGPRPGWSGWFPGDYDNHPNDSPPPYSKNPSDNPQAQNWRPGFWTGAAVGGLGAHLWNRFPSTTRSTPYDWERERSGPSPWFSGRASSPSSNSNDRGEGSSNLGSIRRSTGLGGSNVR